MSIRWYVLMAKPNKDEVVVRQLESRGYELFYPKYVPASGKSAKHGTRAYFPGYIFIRLDLRQHSLSTFQWMPNTNGLVCVGLKPAYIPDNLVEAIRKRTTEAEPTHSGVTHPGGSSDPSGLKVIFDLSLTSEERVKELLQLMQGMNLAPVVGE